MLLHLTLQITPITMGPRHYLSFNLIRKLCQHKSSSFLGSSGLEQRIEDSFWNHHSMAHPILARLYDRFS